MSPPATTDVRLRDRAIARTLPLMPRNLVRRLSAPYIAGETAEQALAVVRSLAARGMSSTVDVLGESITRREQAESTRDQYIAVLGRLASLGDPDLVNVSVKLTALGLAFDRGLAHELTRSIVSRAQELGGFVRIDMEDSPWTDATLALYRELRDEGHERIGVVLQAYLKRSLEDAGALAQMRARVRVVKGIYVEPRSIAFRDMGTINGNFVALSRTLAAAGCHVAFATHDEQLVRATRALVSELGLTTDSYEYQVLLGVREQLRDDLVRDGHPMRIYVPFGAQWYEYSLRRLRENPRVAGHVASDVLRGMRLGRRGRGRGRSRRRAAAGA